MRRRTVLAVAPGAAALLAGCATPQPAPGPTSLAEGRWLVLGPTSDFDPQILPSGWSRIGRQGGDFARRIEAGRFILSLGAPGGDMILRALDIPLEQAPSLSWHWKLERAAFGGENLRAQITRARVFRDLSWADLGRFAVNGPLVLAPEELFLLGDNSSESLDSREWGPIPLSAVIGVPHSVLWPRSRARDL